MCKYFLLKNGPQAAHFGEEAFSKSNWTKVFRLCEHWIASFQFSNTPRLLDWAMLEWQPGYEPNRIIPAIVGIIELPENRTAWKSNKMKTHRRRFALSSINKKTVKHFRQSEFIAFSYLWFIHLALPASLSNYSLQITLHSETNTRPSMLRLPTKRLLNVEPAGPKGQNSVECTRALCAQAALSLVV